MDWGKGRFWLVMGKFFGVIFGMSFLLFYCIFERGIYVKGRV